MPEEQKEAESAEQKRELSSPVFMGMAVSAGILISAVIILKNISKGKIVYEYLMPEGKDVNDLTLDEFLKVPCKLRDYE